MRIRSAKPRPRAEPVVLLAPVDEGVGALFPQLQQDPPTAVPLGVFARADFLLLVGDPERSVIRFRNSGVVCLVREEGNWLLGWTVIPDVL